MVLLLMLLATSDSHVLLCSDAVVGRTDRGKVGGESEDGERVRMVEAKRENDGEEPL